jgi:hypothetical protein
MGGGSSRNDTATDQSVTDQRTGAEGEAVAVGAGANVSITTTDPGAAQLGLAALGIAETSVGRLISFAEAAGQRADKIVGTAAEGDGEKAFSALKFIGGAALAVAAFASMKG